MINRALAPAALYLAILYALNPHLPGHFSSDFYFGGADGYQNVWNLWWVNKSLTELGSSPWFTSWLHAPGGTTLIGHTLNPFNGLLGILLLPWLSLVQTYNAIVVFSFVATGLTAFWLCLAMTGAYAGSLVGGAIVTFSSFHFMHADAHLQLVALQWLPLFVLAWIRYCERPSVQRGLAASAVLLLTALCDLYYFAYAVLTGALFYWWHGRRHRDLFFLFRRGAWAPLCALVAPTLLTSGLLVGALVYTQATDPLLGTHSPRDLSMDLLSPLVWGYYWRFRDSLDWWRALSPYVTEASVHVGWSVAALAVWVWLRRRAAPVAHLPFWGLVCLFFGVMSLGPNLHVAGWELGHGLRISFMGRDDVNPVALPYAVLWLIFPPWRLAGVPVRMMVMVQIALAVMSAGGFEMLRRHASRWRRGLIALFLAVLVVDYLPAPMRVTSPAVPSYVTALGELPGGAVLDLMSPASVSLYYQTVHRKPIAFGYIARTPMSVDHVDQELAAAIRQGEWERLARTYGFRYVVMGATAADLMVRGLDGTPLPAVDGARRVFHDGGVSIYRF